MIGYMWLLSHIAWGFSLQPGFFWEASLPLLISVSYLIDFSFFSFFVMGPNSIEKKSLKLIFFWSLFFPGFLWEADELNLFKQIRNYF